MGLVAHNSQRAPFQRAQDLPIDTPRVDLDYFQVYPDLDPNQQLEITVEDAFDSAAAEVGRTPSTNRISDSCRRPSSKLPQSHAIRAFTPTLANVGYHNRQYEPPETYSRYTNSLNITSPALIYPNDPLGDPGEHDILELCEYDMDTQDAGFLGYINTEFQSSISPEVFECIFSMLELECFKIELKMPIKRVVHMDMETGEDRTCCICNDDFCENLDSMLFCDECDIAVHQNCYGVLFIPEGQWLCRSCLWSRRRRVTCKFCPRTTGGFKPVESTKQDEWAHVLCGLWIPELSFGNFGSMEPIVNSSLIPKARWKLRCSICREATGACIQCTYKNCVEAFHPTCAQAANLYMTMTEGVYGALTSQASMEVRCPTHSPAGTRVDLEAARASLEKERNLFLEQEKARENSPKYPYWRTRKNTPIVPRVVARAIPKFVQARFGIEISNEAMGVICRYWCLKRDAHGTYFSKRIRTILEHNRYIPDESVVQEKLRTISRSIKTFQSIKEMLSSNRDDASVTETEEPNFPEIESLSTAKSARATATLTPPSSPDAAGVEPPKKIVCAICGNPGPKFRCIECHRRFHLDCYDPNFTEVPGPFWKCEECNGRRHRHLRRRSGKGARTRSSTKKSHTQTLRRSSRLRG